MASTTFVLSAFGDEITSDLEEQLRFLEVLHIRYLDLRKAWGKKLLTLGDDDVLQIHRLSAEYGMSIACLASPVGKSPLAEPAERELANLARAFEIGENLNCRRVRVFSFYPPDNAAGGSPDQYLDQAICRLSGFAQLAQREGFTLLLENEKEIVGDTVARVHALVTGVDSPYLRFLWDPANFVQVGEGRATEAGWPLLGGSIGYVHIKDAHLHDGRVCVAGEGDGQISALLDRLKESGYQGFLSLEPHMKEAGRLGGFSGKGGMVQAVSALRRMLDELGCTEVWHLERA